MQDDSANNAQIFVLIINKLGDHQMESYFDSTGGRNGGMLCDHEITETGTAPLNPPLPLTPHLDPHPGTNLTLTQTRKQAQMPHSGPWKESTRSHLNVLKGNIDHGTTKALALYESHDMCSSRCVCACVCACARAYLVYGGSVW